MKRIGLTILSLTFAVPALAGELLIPAVYRGPGAHDTQWRTEIILSNISPHIQPPVPTTITLHRDNGETQEVRMPLAPREVIDVPDALMGWFGIENGGGIVRVTWDDTANTRVVARARVYNVGQHGEYGQSVPGIDVSQLVSEQYLIGLTGLDGNRTNVGVSNPSTREAVVFIGLYDTSGAERGGFVTSVAPRSYRQFNDIFSHFQAGPLNAATVRVQALNAMVYAYASIVRNDTGDATFVMQP